jgi:hypothetical protein
MGVAGGREGVWKWLYGDAPLVDGGAVAFAGGHACSARLVG